MLSLSMTPSHAAVMRSIALRQNALNLDPAFSRARSLLAIQYTSCVMFGFPFPAALELAWRQVTSALALDRGNGETHCAAAVIDCLSGDWLQAEESFRTAHSLTVDPLVGGQQCASLSLSVGHVGRALRQAEHVLRVSPTHPIGVHMLAALHATRGCDEQAGLYARLAVDLGQPPSIAPLADIVSGLAPHAGEAAAAARHMRCVFPLPVSPAQLFRLMRHLCAPNS